MKASSISDFAAWLSTDTKDWARRNDANWTRNQGNIQVAYVGQIHEAMYHRPHQSEY